MPKFGVLLWKSRLGKTFSLALVAAGVALLSLAVAGEFTRSPGPSLKPFLNLVKEVSQYRRLNVLHPNPQSIFDGQLLGVVHAGSGNLTFQRRDLVAWLSGPVTIARIYDSRIAENPDFGTGWRLSLAEELQVGEDQAIRYIDGSGASYWFIPSDEGYVVSPPTPRHNRSVLSMENDTATLEMDDGSARRFARNGSESTYRLTVLEPASSSALRFSYADGLLRAIERDGQDVFRIERLPDGKIASVTDLHGRVVKYRYRRDGFLMEVQDIAGHRWKHQYDIQGRLTGAIGPNHRAYLRVAYDSQGRVLESDTGQAFSFTYYGGVTEAMEGASRKHVFKANSDGVTTGYSSSSGVAWQLELDDRNRITELSSNGHEYRYTYRGDGLLERMRSRTQDGEDELEFEYDSHGRLSQALSTVTKDRIAISHEDGWTRIDGPSLDFRFRTKDSRIASIVDNDQREWEIDYRNAAIVGIHRGGQSLRLARDASSRIVAIGYPDQRVSRYQYDALGNRQLLDWGVRGSTRYGHDVAGNIVAVEVTNPDGSTLRQRTRIGEMNTVEEVDYEGSTTLSVRYDGMRRPIAFDTGDDTVHVNYRGDGEVDSLRSETNGERWLNDQRESLPPPLPPPYRRALSPDDPVPAGTRHRVIDFDPVTLHPMASDPLELGVPGLAKARAILAVAAPLFGEDTAEARRKFEKPSNPVFQALEYRSVNCCVGCPTCVLECVRESEDADGDGEIDETPPREYCYCVGAEDNNKGIGGGSDECEDGEECGGEAQECPEGEECKPCPDADEDGECDCRDSDGNGVCDCLKDENNDGVCECPYGANESGHCLCRDDEGDEGEADGVCDDCEDENGDRICDCPDEDEDGECDCEDSNNDGICDCPEDEDGDGVCDCDDIDNDGECDPVCETRALVVISSLLEGWDYLPQGYVPIGTLGSHCKGDLTLIIEGQTLTNDYHVETKRAIPFGFHKVKLYPDNIPVGRYFGFKATWDVPNQLRKPWRRAQYVFEEFAEQYTHTQYTQSKESHSTCSTGPRVKAYIIDEDKNGNVEYCWHDADGNDVYTETTFPQTFREEVYENGSGISINYGPIQVEDYCLDNAPQGEDEDDEEYEERRRKRSEGRPDDASKENTFRDVTGAIKPSCTGETVMHEKTVAVSDEPNEVFSCGNMFFATREEGDPGKKKVTDTCPLCPKTRVDHYVEDGRCTGIVDWGSEGKTFKLPW